MIQLEQRIFAFDRLGDFLRNINPEDPTYDRLFETIKHAKSKNGWFSKENVLHAFAAWGQLLNKKDLTQWLLPYSFDHTAPKTVGLVLAGNIPLVGFHDFLSVLIYGHTVLVKQSSSDNFLLPFLAKYIEYFEPSFKGKIEFTEGKLTNFDAVIATGSNNTARYFEHYFKGKPNIIRKNRNSVAVLTGNETDTELANLGNDIFQYFGLGCRSVSKLFVPVDYNFDAFFNGMYQKRDIINNAKYANNYDYNKAVYLMSLYDLLENGFLMLKEDESYSSPIATVFYEYYSDINDLKEKLHKDADKIQCVVSNGVLDSEVPFGKTQNPELWDYADGINTLDFLSKI